jgi:hypothetical protein
LSESPPAGFIEALRAAMPAPTPPEEQGAMIEQDFESWSLRDLAVVAKEVVQFAGRS